MSENMSGGFGARKQISTTLAISISVLTILGLTLSWIVLAGYVKPALRALRTGRQARQIL